MANRVIQFSKSQSASSALSNEVYLDISTVAVPVNSQIDKADKPNFEDYVQLLEAEDNISAIVTDPNDRSQNICIALLSGDLYIRDYNKWQLYMQRPQNKLQKLVNVNAIKNSIHNIFSWTPGERILNPEFGSNLRKLLYEGITDFNQEQIIAEIRHSVSQWEPRVQIDNIVKLTDIDDKENNTVHLRIIYSIPTLTTEQFYYDYDANAPG